MKMTFLILFMTIVFQRLNAQVENCQIIYKGKWSKPYGPIYNKVELRKDSIFSFGYTNLQGVALNKDSFIVNKFSEINFNISGDSLLYKQDSNVFNVFSVGAFKEKMPTYFVRSFINYLDLREFSLIIFYPETISKIQNEICYVYETYFINSYNEINIGEIKSLIKNKNIDAIDGNYKKNKTYFFPNKGLIFFQNDILKGFDIIYQNQSLKIFSEKNNWIN